MTRVIEKIREKGFPWLLWRLRRELRYPTIPLLRTVLDNVISLKQRALSMLLPAEKDDYLYAVYDLDINAITFNFAQFLIDAEFEANRHGKKGFVVVFVPPSHDQRLVWSVYDSVIDQGSREWRFQNILIPLTTLSTKCMGYFVLPARSATKSFIRGREVFPALYDGVNLRSWDGIAANRKLNRPGLFQGLSASKQGLRYIEAWKQAHGVDKPLVTITLRNQPFDPVRNSNINAWAKFANHLPELGYYPVVIPDTDKSFAPEAAFDGIACLRECAWNLGLRMALYESAFLNFIVTNGVIGLLMFNPRCSYICMNNLSAEGSLIDTPEAWGKHNLTIGEDFKFSTPRQRLIFKPDTYENIVSEFELFIKQFSDNSHRPSSCCEETDRLQRNIGNP